MYQREKFLGGRRPAIVQCRAMKTVWQRWAWPLGKTLLAVLILVVIGRKFSIDLQGLDLTQLQLRPGWLALSGGLYLLGVLTSAWYWRHLLRVFGQRPPLLAVLCAYFVGHLGKYVPGKAWALLLRGSLVRGPETRFGVAIIATFYEVLTTMAAGGLAAAVIFAVDPPKDIADLGWHPLLTSLLLLALCVVPLFPGVFNFLVGRMARRFERIESFRLPRLRTRTLLLGLTVTGAGWLFLGLGVWAILQGMLHEPPGWSLAVWMRCTAGVGLAYVAGFLIVFLPGGIGAREFILAKLLAFAGPTDAAIEAAVLSLRLLWTGMELAAAGILLGVRHASGLAAAPAASPQAGPVETPL
jgi:glycosyltransferase 2 family protein